MKTILLTPKQKIIAKCLANDMTPMEINIKYKKPSESSWSRKLIERMKKKFNVKTCHGLVLKLKQGGYI